jgi:hypothetical protein
MPVYGPLLLNSVSVQAAFALMILVEHQRPLITPGAVGREESQSMTPLWSRPSTTQYLTSVKSTMVVIHGDEN